MLNNADDAGVIIPGGRFQDYAMMLKMKVDLDYGRQSLLVYGEASPEDQNVPLLFSKKHVGLDRMAITDYPLSSIEETPRDHSAAPNSTQATTTMTARRTTLGSGLDSPLSSLTEFSDGSPIIESKSADDGSEDGSDDDSDDDSDYDVEDEIAKIKRQAAAAIADGDLYSSYESEV